MITISFLKINTMKRIQIYEKLWNYSQDLYMIVFTIRQLFYFLQGRKALLKFGNRSLQEHINW